MFILLFFTTFTLGVYAEKEIEYLRTIETPHPEEHGWFGSPMAMDGDLILISSWQADVGDKQNVGQAYLYNVDGTLIASYQSPNPDTLDTFSSAIDISGDRVLIGDYSDQGDWNYIGRAYLFDTNGNHIKTFEPPSPTGYGGFGGSGVCFASNRIIISETGGETEVYEAGIVHLYDDEGTYLKAIYSPSPIAAGHFGLDIEGGDELFLVNEVANPSTGISGTVYGFDYDGNHIMTLRAPEPEDRACFGNSIAISGDKIVIGEHHATVDGIYRAGRAYLFDIDGEHLQTFESPSPDLGAEFGFVVSVEGDTVVIGEPYADVTPNMKEGKAYVFDVEGNLLETLVSPSPVRAGLYGDRVKINGEIIVISEGWAEVDGEERAGAVHIYSWKSKGGFIVPGFPFESLVLGIGVVSVALLMLAQRRRTLAVNP